MKKQTFGFIHFVTARGRGTTILNVVGGAGFGIGLRELLLGDRWGVIPLVCSVYLIGLVWFRLGYKAGMLKGIIMACSNQDIVKIYDTTFKDI